MKKSRLYLWLLLLTGGLNACNSSETVTADTGNNQQVRLGVNINHGVKTRANAPTPPQNYALRCILEVWDINHSNLLYRQELLASNEETLNFTFELANPGNYQVFAWADFIQADAEKTTVEIPVPHDHYADLYYKTNGDNGLKEIFLIPENYAVNAESRDAFYTSQIIYKEDVAYEKELILNRPFAQLNIIEKEAVLLENISQTNFTYRVPSSFNTEKGMPGDEVMDVKQTVTTLPTPSANYNANLLYDYIFASPVNSLLASEIKIAFTSIDSEKQLQDFTIPGNNLPLVANKRTNARGSMLHFTSEMDASTNISIYIDTEWMPENEYGLPNNNYVKVPNFNNQNNPFKYQQQ